MSIRSTRSRKAAPAKSPDLSGKLAHTIKPSRGPAAQLETLADAAQLIADLEQFQASSAGVGSCRGNDPGRREDEPESGYSGGDPLARGCARKGELAQGVAMKSDHERRVFLQFVKAANIHVEEDSVESRPEPEPDIRCIWAGESVYFELARLLDREAPKLRVRALKIAPQQVAVDPKRFGLPERDMLRTKLSKSYQTDGLPLELLLYFDAENPLVAGTIPPFDFAMHARTVMAPLLTPMPAHIRRVWVFERYRGSVLWSYPANPEGER